MKDVRRQHFHPLTDGNFALKCLDGQQTTRFQCGMLGPYTLDSARIALFDVSPDSLGVRAKRARR